MGRTAASTRCNYELMGCVQLFDASFPMDKPNPRLIRGKLNFAESMETPPTPRGAR